MSVISRICVRSMRCYPSIVLEVLRSKKCRSRLNFDEYCFVLVQLRNGQMYWIVLLESLTSDSESAICDPSPSEDNAELSRK